MIKLVVLDIAGTTVHDGDSVGACFKAALAKVGVQPPEREIAAVMGLPKPDAVRILMKGAGRTPTDEEVNALHADFTAQMIDYYAHNPAVREIPGASQAIAELRAAGMKVALNSGFGRSIVEVLMKRLGWNAIVDATICSDEVANGRPHPDMIQVLMKRFAIQDPKQVAKVGDTWSDLEEGVNAGCGLNLGVVTGVFTREELVQRPHTRILDSVIEVPALIRAFNQKNA